MNVEFTDRYDGKPPSWLRGCHEDCEATGVVPILGPPRVPPADRWMAAHVAAGDHDCDGWHFVTCLACAGTGRVAWFVTLARVPRWLWRGLAFMRWGLRADVHPPEWGFWKRFRVTFYACYGADIVALAR